MAESVLSNSSEWLVVIPARLGSTRLPEKPLQDLAGKSLIARVYDNLQPLRDAGLTTVVATDAPKIADHCQALNINVQMTDAQHVSGTDRCAEVAKQSTARFILNVQGDEPFISTDDLLEMAAAFTRSECAMATLYIPVDDARDFNNPNVVKVVMDQQHRALYFSRAAIPSYRDETGNCFNKHLGTYAYRRDILLALATMQPTTYEKSEKLEQLRALEHGYGILMHRASKQGIGIDTPADLERARAHYL